MILWLFSFTIVATGGNHDTKDSSDIGFVSYKVNTNSWMTLSGTTNINSFECISKSGVSGGIIMADSESGDNSVNISDLNLSVDVSSFDCKNPFITRDMYKTLGGDVNSSIEIKLLDIEPISRDNGVSHGNLTANAVITVNGRSNNAELIIDWHQHDPFKYHFKGNTELCMSDFNIDPPSPALGLVKVSDKITVRFNYIIQTNAVSLAE